MKLANEHTNVYTKDGYGGIAMLELDWGQDVIWDRGDLNDGFSSIQEHFENRSDGWHESLIDCIHDVDAFTEIEVD